jgi:hypothetical protein
MYVVWAALLCSVFCSSFWHIACRAWVQNTHSLSKATALDRSFYEMRRSLLAGWAVWANYNAHTYDEFVACRGGGGAPRILIQRASGV